MKKLVSIMMVCAATMTFTPLARAQTTPASSTQSNQDPRVLSDKTLSDRLQKDLTTRNSTLGSQPVTWYDAGYGYYGTYSMDSKDYMVRYDRQGNYVETLNRRTWDDTVSSSTRTAFNNSRYKDQQVTGYWEVTDPGRKGYYFELSDKTGKRSRVWADEKGKFTNQPGTSTASPHSNP